MTRDIVIKFPNSKRRLTPEEEQAVRKCVNLIHMTYGDKNPFVKPEQRIIQCEDIIRDCIKKIFELNEDEQ